MAVDTDFERIVTMSDGAMCFYCRRYKCDCPDDAPSGQGASSETERCPQKIATPSGFMQCDKNKGHQERHEAKGAKNVFYLPNKAKPLLPPSAPSLREKINANLAATGDWLGRSPEEVSLHHEATDVPPSAEGVVSDRFEQMDTDLLIESCKSLQTSLTAAQEAADRMLEKACWANAQRIVAEAEVSSLRSQLDDVVFIHQCSNCKWMGNPTHLGKKCQYCPEGVCIRIATSREGEHWTVQLSNWLSKAEHERDELKAQLAAREPPEEAWRRGSILGYNWRHYRSEPLPEAGPPYIPPSNAGHSMLEQANRGKA